MSSPQPPPHSLPSPSSSPRSQRSERAMREHYRDHEQRERCAHKAGHSAAQDADLADVLDQNARLWKRVHALQERAHDMCAENVDLRRQINTLRTRKSAMAPLSLDTSLLSGSPVSPVQMMSSLRPSPMMHSSPMLPSPMHAPSSLLPSLSHHLPTPISAHSPVAPSATAITELKNDVARLEGDNSQLLSLNAEARTTIRTLRREVEVLTRDRDRCTCRHSLRPETAPTRHRRSSSNLSGVSGVSGASGVSGRSESGEWEGRVSPTRRKWDWERLERAERERDRERERSDRGERDEARWASPPDIVAAHMRPASVRSGAE